MYKTIVLALDESDGSAAALPYAVNLARRDASTLVIAHARTHALETSQEAMLEQTVEGLRSGGIDAQLEIRTEPRREGCRFPERRRHRGRRRSDRDRWTGPLRPWPGRCWVVSRSGCCMWRPAPSWSFRCTRTWEPSKPASQLREVPRAERGCAGEPSG